MRFIKPDQAGSGQKQLKTFLSALEKRASLTDSKGNVQAVVEKIQFNETEKPFDRQEGN
jgi:hypothetical protein